MFFTDSVENPRFNWDLGHVHPLQTPYYSTVHEGSLIRAGSEPIHDVDYWKKGLRHSVYFTHGTIRAIEQISATCGIPEESVRHVLMGNLGTRYRVSEIGSGEFWEGAKNHWECRSQTSSSRPSGSKPTNRLPGP